MNSSGIVLVHAMFKTHGFRQTNKDNWNVMWTSAHLKSYVFQGLRPHQKVNQFPRSYEVTRKDSLARNIGRMLELHGQWDFGFLPESFVLPVDRPQFLAACKRDAVRSRPTRVRLSPTVGRDGAVCCGATRSACRGL